MLSKRRRGGSSGFSTGGANTEKADSVDQNAAESFVSRGRAVAGRVCSTSLRLLTLEVYYRHLPLYSI